MNTKQCFDRYVYSVSSGSLSNHCSGDWCKINSMRLQRLKWLQITLCQTEKHWHVLLCCRINNERQKRVFILYMWVYWWSRQHVASRWTDIPRKNTLHQTLNGKYWEVPQQQDHLFYLTIKARLFCFLTF